jgi:hypothetical protein
MGARSIAIDPAYGPIDISPDNAPTLTFIKSFAAFS